MDGDIFLPYGVAEDDELLAAVLEIGDPRELPGYVEVLPVGVDPVEIAYYYTLPDGEIQCGLPNCRTWHKKGYGVRLSDGNHMALGYICGKEICGADWDTMVAHFDRRIRRARYLRRIRPLQNLIDEALLALVSWEFPLKRIGQFKRALMDFYWRLFCALEDAAQRREGKMTIVSDDGGGRSAYNEALAAMRVKTDRYSEKSYGKFPGVVLLDKHDRAKMLAGVVRELKRLRDGVNPDGLTNAEMSQVFTRLQRIIDRLRQIREDHYGFVQSLNRDSLGRLVAWATDHPDIEDEFVLTKSGIRRSGGQELAIPDDVVPLDDTPIEILRRRPDLETREVARSPDWPPTAS